MAGERWRKLEVWQLSDRWAREVYDVTKRFPKSEVYGLTAQLRRAALSVPTNIVEGYSRRGDKELGYFLNISVGSLAETKYLLHFARSLGYLDQAEYERLDVAYDEVGAKLWAFYDKVRGGT